MLFLLCMPEWDRDKVLLQNFPELQFFLAEGHHDSALTHMLYTVITFLGVADHKVNAEWTVEKLVTQLF